MTDLISINPDLDLWLLLANTRHALYKVSEKQLAQYDISPRQAHVLIMIRLLGNKATLENVAKHVSRAVNSISMLITGMEKKGLIQKIRDVPRTNKIRFEITDKGLRAYHFIINEKSVETIMSILSEEERQQLKLCLNKLLKKSSEM
jgi:DNA-binding MarR family transcriptional regulator